MMQELRRVVSRDHSQEEGAHCHGEVSMTEGWSPPNLPDRIQGLTQEDPELVREICENWLLPPVSVERTLANPDQKHYSQINQSEIIDALLKQKENGFFIESGAFDGETLSNSLFFEKSRNWTGLLVEANPANFQSLLGKNRRAYKVNSCVSPTRAHMVIPMHLAGIISGLDQYMGEAHQRRIESTLGNKTADTVAVECFPVFAILQAIGVTHVDYFSLDVEGSELGVLQSLPLDKITVDVFSIEYLSSDYQATMEKLNAIKKLLVHRHGYTVIREVPGEEDVILKRNV
jgi:hypothetical protein